jgi:hypothetical protein
MLSGWGAVLMKSPPPDVAHFVRSIDLPTKGEVKDWVRSIDLPTRGR